MSKLKHFIVTGLCAAIGATAAVSAHAWDLWDAFKTASVDNARVVDRSDERKITTSEGQSYALFFALAADDRTTFDALLSWTEQNLSGGDFLLGSGAKTKRPGPGRFWIPIMPPIPTCGSPTTCLKPDVCGKMTAIRPRAAPCLNFLKKKSAPLMVLAT